MTSRDRRGRSAQQHWAGRYRTWLALSGCAASVFVASAVVGFEHCGHLIWFTNGVALSYLLLAPRWLWIRYFIVIFGGMLAGGLIVDPENWRGCVTLSLCNVLEVGLAAAALRKRSARLPRFCDHRYLLRFALYAVVGAPVLTSLLLAAASAVWSHRLSWSAAGNWISTDGLGNAITTPACVALFQNRLEMPRNSKTPWFFALLLIVLTLGAFAQWRLPLLFLIYPVVSLIMFRFGIGWAAISTLFVTAVASWFTIHNTGPFAAVNASLGCSPTLFLQFFLACGVFLVFSSSSVLHALQGTERRLRETANLHELVTENSRDVIIFADFEGRRSYVSAAAERLGRWSSEELLGRRSLELVHPEDRGRVRSLIERLRMGGHGELIEYRIEDINGRYIWVEGNLHGVRDPSTGVLVGILNMLRDISKRKEADQKLKEAYATLEALAATDSLTRLANRRAFDQCLANEWRRCLRERKPLSVLLIDADWFKSYNDTYGHPRGDRCLEQIAESALDVVNRAGDVVARIGGEEFAVILPNTCSTGAIEVGNKICAALRCRKILHSSNPLGVVTVSVGVATAVPAMGEHVSTLVQQADEALYRAKRAGRNCVCSSEPDRLEKAESGKLQTKWEPKLPFLVQLSGSR